MASQRRTLVVACVAATLLAGAVPSLAVGPPNDPPPAAAPKLVLASVYHLGARIDLPPVGALDKCDFDAPVWVFAGLWLGSAGNTLTVNAKCDRWSDATCTAVQPAAMAFASCAKLGKQDAGKPTCDSVMAMSHGAAPSSGIAVCKFY